jgi:hypothetical protein
MLKIKKLYQKTRMAFGASGLPLGKRSKDEILDLAIIARESNNPTILDFFEEIPELHDLRKMKLGVKVSQNKAKFKKE